MAQALYRKYRPQSLDEVVGQTHVTEVLKKTLLKDRLSHAYLLTGPRGVGKTSIARILAYEINGLPYSTNGHLDIIEIDAASNNGVDDVRDLRSKVTIVPVSASKKVYIVDEVHMLSRAAFNALLKTLEEPPEHVVFILATTEVHKLPDTILSRTQRFHFRLISPEDMVEHLQQIAKKEKINISDDALRLIGQRARGSFRDAISLLDQLSNISHKTITSEMIEDMLGLASSNEVEKLANAIVAGQLQETVSILTNLENAGVSAVVLCEQLSHSLKQRVVTEPQLIDLIESLIDVPRSHDPSLKLLAVTAAASSRESKPSSKISKSLALETTREKAIITPAPIIDTSKKNNKESIQNFDWLEVVAFVKSHHIALFGILQKADASFDGSTLALHFSYLLHRKKLEDGKYRQLLTQSLVTLYKHAPDIQITSGKKPPSNKQAAAVAVIMGGGEEVTI